MPTQTLTNGDVLAVSDTAQVYDFASHQSHRGCLDNKDGPNTVYINWLGGDVVRTKAAGANKCWIDKGETIRIPANVRSFCMRCLDGETAVVRHISD